MRLKVLYLIVLVCGCVMGAGFVSGSELWLYFGQYGVYAIPLVAVFALVFSSGVYKVMQLKHKYNIKSLQELSFALSPKLGKYVDYILKSGYIFFASAMIAGMRIIGGEITVLCTLVVSYIVVVLNKRILTKINLVLVPIVVVFVLSLFYENFDTIQLSNLIDLPAFIGAGLVGVLFYSCVNLLLVIGALLRSYTSLTKKATLIVAILSGLILSVLAIVVLIIISPDNFNTLEFPLIGVAFAGGTTSAIAGEILLIASILTTFIACIFGMRNNNHTKSELLIVLLIVYLLSLMGFYDILKAGYFVLGILSFVYYCALMKKH